MSSELVAEATKMVALGHNLPSICGVRRDSSSRPMLFFPPVSFLPTFPSPENRMEGRREDRGSVVREERRRTC